MRTTVTIKKYGNRRLYDTAQSRYVTLDEVAAVIRGGDDVEIIDASSGADLTQPTLIQIIVESGGAERLLPAPLLTRLIRMHDTAVAALMGQWMTQALDAYLTGQGVAESLTPYAPAAKLPFDATNALARMMVAGLGLMPSAGQVLGQAFGLGPAPGTTSTPPAPHSTASPPPHHDDDIAELRRELQALRRDLERDKESPPERPARLRKKRG